MPETKKMTFSHREVVEALLKKADIHEGLWGIYIEFGLAGANVATPGGEFTPAAIVGIKSIGLQHYDEVSNLTVDAAQVNPIATGAPEKKRLLRRAKNLGND